MHNYLPKGISHLKVTGYGATVKQKFYYVIKAGLVLCVVYQLVIGLNCWENYSPLTGTRYKKTHVTVQDNIETHT